MVKNLLANAGDKRSILGLGWQEDWSGLPFPSPGDHPDPGKVS